VQHLAELEPLRRYATLTALVLELTATLTDEALNMFEHLVGVTTRKCQNCPVRDNPNWTILRRLA
jgi:hypothetical protein